MKELYSNGFALSIAQAIEEMKAEQGDSFSLDRINLAELERRSGVSRGKLRRLKRNGFQELPRSTKGRKHANTKLSGYTGIIDSLLQQGVKNSSVILDRLRHVGFDGGATIIKEYIVSHKHLIPAKRQQIAPHGNRGRRYTTGPGEAYQMDWGFTDVLDYSGQTYRAACFAMICHHCGQRYIEFFPNARQENLFIGMIHAFQYMGIPRFLSCIRTSYRLLISDTQYHPPTLIAIPTGQSYQIVINWVLNGADPYSLFCDAIFEGVRLQKKHLPLWRSAERKITFLPR